MKAVLLGAAPGVPLVDLMADAPAHDPMAAAYLFASFVDEFAPGTVFLAVVDPGVGSARRAVSAEIDGRWYVAPDNGLLEPLLRRAKSTHAWEIAWRPERLSASFHGRDLFAPIAARLARGEHPTPPWAQPLALELLRRPAWPDELARVIYVDHFGNAWTGLRAHSLPAGGVLEAAGQRIPRARTFGEVPRGSAFWYENSSGLAEIAVNQGRAEQALGLALGSPVSVHES